MSIKKIDGSIALVTGANRGIGKALVEELMDRGAAKVYAGARNVQSLKPLQDSYGDRLVALELDVTSEKQVQDAAEKANDVNLVINNAGFADGTPPEAPGGIEAARVEMEVNYFGTVRVLSAFSPALTRNRGAAANVISIGGLTNFTPYPTYSASKAAAHSITQAFRATLGSQGVLVSGIYPGPVDTDMSRAISMEKATPRSVAAKILDGLVEGREEIFPDVMAEQFGAQWLDSPKDSERQIAAMMSAMTAEA